MTWIVSQSPAMNVAGMAANLFAALAAQVILFPAIGLQMTVLQNMRVATGLGMIVVLRSYVTRFTRQVIGQAPGGMPIFGRKTAATDRPRSSRVWP